MNRIILEGITGAGKSTLYKHLSKMLSERYANIYFINEYYTLRLIEEEVGNQQNFCSELMNRLLDDLSFLDRSYNSSNLHQTSKGKQQQFQMLFESFHLNNYVRGYIDSMDKFREIEEKLKNLNVKLIQLVIPEEHILEQSIISTQKYRTSGWIKYLQTIGENDQERANYFYKKQNEMLDLFHESVLQKKIIYTQQGEWNDYAEQIKRFCEEEV